MSATVTRHPAVGTSYFERGIRRDDMTPRAEGLHPGDVILVHSHGRLAPRLIGFGQRLHHDPAFAYWTHAAVYAGEWQPGTPMLIEAKGGSPVRYVPLSQYDVRDYAAVRFFPPAYPPGVQVAEGPQSVMRSNAVRFCRSRLGRGYGYLTIATLALWSLLGGRLTVGLSGDDVCSGLAAQAAMYLGEVFPGSPETTMPADLAEKWDVRR